MLNNIKFNPNANGDPSGKFTPDFLAEIRRLLLALQEQTGSSEPAEAIKGRQAARAKKACQIVDLKPSSFHARQNPADPSWDPSFPRSFKLGDSPRSATVWFVDELESWLESRAATRRLVTKEACR